MVSMVCHYLASQSLVCITNTKMLMISSCCRQRKILQLAHILKKYTSAAKYISFSDTDCRLFKSTRLDDNEFAVLYSILHDHSSVELENIQQ